MNRIYQGRVSTAQLLDSAGNDATPPDWNWEGALWEHHALFQDAVNYYVFCLLALASDPQGRIFPIRAKLAEIGSEHGVWEAFPRRGAKRQGMRESILRTLGIAKPDATPEECFAVVLAGNPFANDDAGRALLDLALQLLLVKLDGEGKIRDGSKSYGPRFFFPKNDPTWDYTSETLAAEAAGVSFRTEIHSARGAERLGQLAGRYGLECIVNLQPNAKSLMGEAAKARLRDALEHLQTIAKSGEPRADTEPPRAHQWLRSADVGAVLAGALDAVANFEGTVPPHRGGNINMDPVYAFIAFKYSPDARPVAAEFLRQCFPLPEPKAGTSTRKQKEDEKRERKERVDRRCRELGDDPIKRARGERGFVFRAFTSLPMWGADDPARLAWKDFDIAAFAEALKALHQVEAKGEERAKERERLQERAGVMRGKTKWKPNPLKSEPEPSLLEGDERIKRLEHIVDHELKQDYEMSEGVPVAYGLHPRTIRGFRDLRREWAKVVAPGEEFSEAKKGKLLEKLREYQKENPTIVGSVRLYEVLLEKGNWLIWQEPPDPLPKWWKKEFASDPVQALTDERHLKGDIERLGHPIKFTPADAVHSRRQYYFSGFDKNSRRKELGHDANQRSLRVEIAERGPEGWRKQLVRLHYSAPRFLRDRLRVESDEVLANVPFLQPMMEALNGVEAMPQDFSKCPVALMPEECASGDRRILLNFPITIDPAALAKALGKAEQWERQFVAFDDQNFYVKWPEREGAEKKTSDVKKTKKEVVPWWQSVDGFRCLAVDLGQRDAGACALLDVRANHDFGCDKKGRPRLTREIGTTESGGKKKVWRAHVAATCLLRLPGEDARVIRDGAWTAEFYGERGRSADPHEWEQTQRICTDLGLVPDDVLGADPKWHSFPELNGRLLFALRRAQTHLARFQRWSWMLTDKTIVKMKGDDKTEQDVERRVKVCAEIAESDEATEEWKTTAAQRDFDQLVSLAAHEANRLRATLQRALVLVANRVAPLRGRNWEWVTRDDDATCHILRQTERGSDDAKKKLCGQRGLSMERLEQFEELRRRCQSLNRALRQTPGERPKLGAGTRGVELPDPCPDLLVKMDELREQRVNQTAHLILAQALGVRLRAPQKDRPERARKDIHGEYERFREPADFIVLEDLARYLSSQGRARNENSRLMKWCHRAILGKLKDLCAPYGIPVVEATASYSSRFCSRTGVAGFRAIELTSDAKQEWLWKRHFDRIAAVAADPTKKDKERDDEAQRVKALFDTLDEINAGRCEAGKPLRTLLAPMPGGPIFLPLQPRNGERRPATQADINAAINLGLRAIAAPDCHDIHVRMRAEFDKAGTFHIRTETKREKARWGTTAPEIRFTAHKADQQRASLAKDSPRANFFIDHGWIATCDWGRIDGVNRAIASGRGIWSSVRRKEWATVNTFNNDRLEKWKLPRRFDEGSVRPPRTKAEGELDEDQIPGVGPTTPSL